MSTQGMRHERGDGDVHRKPGSRFWHLRFWHDGRLIRKSTGETDEGRARRVLERTRSAVRAGVAAPQESRVCLADLVALVEQNYAFKRNRSTATMKYSVRHLTTFFGPSAKARTLGLRIDEYVTCRRDEGAADASIRIELALLQRAFRLAVEKRLMAPGAIPHITRPPEDPSRVRQGFLSRGDVERLCALLPPDVSDLVGFLFWSAWRVNEARRLEWRTYFPADQTIRLPAALSKNKRERILPVGSGPLGEIVARRLAARRLGCPHLFHRAGQPIGDFRKVWATACKAMGLSGRIVHDLRRSGVKHLIEAGLDPHTAMAFSGHRTPSMLQRYHIIDIDRLRVAAEQAGSYAGRTTRVIPLTSAEPAQPALSARRSGASG